jgi:hypothetical protein
MWLQHVAQAGCESYHHTSQDKILTYAQQLFPTKESFGSLVLFGIIITNVLVTVLLTKASMMNYPGGEALAFFNRQYTGQDDGKYPLSSVHSTIFFSLLHA